MSDLDFYAQAIVTGRVAGLGASSVPEQWEHALGAEYLDDRRKTLTRRDFGLVEVYFERRGGFWECFGVGIQVHRLANRHAVAPAPLRKDFGEFEKLVSFARLDTLISQMGHHLIGDNDAASTAHDSFILPESRARVHVVSQVESAQVEGPRVGDVWSIHLSYSKKN